MFRSDDHVSFLLDTPSECGDLSTTFNVDAHAPPDPFARSLSSLSHGVETDAGYAEYSSSSAGALLADEFRPPFCARDLVDCGRGVDLTAAGDGGVVKVVTRHGLGSTPGPASKAWIRLKCYREGDDEPYDAKYFTKVLMLPLYYTAPPSPPIIMISYIFV